LGMLKKWLDIIRHPENLLPKALERTPNEMGKARGGRMFSDLDRDFQELTDQVDEHIKRVANRSTVMVSILMMEESRKGINQAEDIRDAVHRFSFTQCCCSFSPER
jgi:hypothetical protein